MCLDRSRPCPHLEYGSGICAHPQHHNSSRSVSRPRPASISHDPTQPRPASRCSRWIGGEDMDPGTARLIETREPSKESDAAELASSPVSQPISNSCPCTEQRPRAARSRELSSKDRCRDAGSSAVLRESAHTKELASRYGTAERSKSARRNTGEQGRKARNTHRHTRTHTHARTHAHTVANHQKARQRTRNSIQYIPGIHPYFRNVALLVPRIGGAFLAPLTPSPLTNGSNLFAALAGSPPSLFACITDLAWL